MTGPENSFDVTGQFRTRDEVAAELLARIADRDPTAWEEILHRYSKLVAATVRSFRLSESDALDAVQMTWLRLAENPHRIKPERLGGWLATTARRECLYILRQARTAAERIDMKSEIIAESSVGPEQHVVDADASRGLWKVVDELSPRQRNLLRTLFTEPRPYTDVSRSTGIPLGGIGPTRARALRQLLDRLSEQELGSEVTSAEDAKVEITESNKTGSNLLDDLLDKADHALREKLNPKVTESTADSTWSTGNAQLDDLLHKADAALHAALSDR
jgi:RNA polymerase sigma factor (sigma-70 family)